MKVEETDRINKNWDDIWKGEDKEEIRQFLRKYSEIELPEFFNEQDIKNACNNIMIRIKNGDYDFGGILIKNSNNNFIDLMIYSLKTDDIKLLIEERKKLGLDSSTVVEMILATGDLEYIEEYVRNGESLNLEQAEIDRLSLFTKKTNINLPPEMTIGVEIETEENGKNNAEIRQNFLSKTNWSTQRDNSLINGIEIVSPILTGNTKISSDEIRRVCAVLSGVSQTTSERCGGHIHIGANYLTSKQDWVNLIQIWTNSEKVLYIISNEKGKIPRNVVMEYALPISRKIENAIQTGTISLEGEEDLNEFISTVSKIQEDRISSINFKNVGNIEKNTIEFRLSNGTLNPNTWIENINLFGGIVRSAHEISIIQGKLEEQRTKEERKMIENFEVLQTEQNDKKVAKSLIELCISPEERQVYMDRYTLNKQLLEKNAPEMESAINMQISTNKIVNKIFSGKNAVKGEDYKQVVTFIENDLERSEIMQGKEKWE